MEAYDAMARAFDELFPPSPDFAAFIGPPPGGPPGGPAGDLGDPARAIDLGCATGAHVEILAGLGWDALGLDPSKTMLAEARRSRGCPERFAAGTMLDLGKAVQEGGAGLILCVGNTLPHLGRGELGDFLRLCARSLAPAGRLVIQLLNYARISALRPEALPDAIGGAWRLGRSYRYRADGAIEFSTTLHGPETPAGGTATLWPFAPGEILASAFNEGFEAEGVYESWARAPFDPEASATCLLDLRLGG